MAALARRAIARAPAASPASSLHRVLGERATSLPVRARRALVARASSPGDPGWNDGSETISVALDRPMGIVLNSGRDGVGAYVAELVDGGNAAKDGSLRVGDVLLSCGTAADADEASSVVAKDFDDVMAALGADPDASAMRLTLKRFKDGPNRTKPEGRVWLEGNALRDGVTTTPSGLQYEVLESGSGPAGRVALDTKCECHCASPLPSRVRSTRVSFSPSVLGDDQSCVSTSTHLLESYHALTNPDPPPGARASEPNRSPQTPGRCSTAPSLTRRTSAGNR
mgnify:CR=1 FL=1|jgi:hypothetical protein